MRRVKRLFMIGADTHDGHEVVKGIHAYCRVHGRWDYRLARNNSSESVAWAKVELRQWKADGIIANIMSRRVERLVRTSGLPAINVSNFRDAGVPLVRADSFGIGQMVADYFLESKFQRFAFCAENLEAFVRLRYQGFAQKLSSRGFDCGLFIAKYAGKTTSAWVKNHQRMEAWLLSIRKPVAVMCVHDLRAMAVADACHRLDLRVPEDVAIVGVGNEDFFCQTCSPPLSTVDTDLQRVGYEAARKLDRLLQGGRASAKPVLVPPRRVIVRMSSDIVAIDDPDTAAAVRFIRQHAHEPITVKDVLAEVPICRKTMELRFAKWLGRTPKAEITRLRLERAKSLLEETDLLIPNVARNTGFISPRIFSSFFRSRVGMLPTQYRRNCRSAAGW